MHLRYCLYTLLPFTEFELTQRLQFTAIIMFEKMLLLPLPHDTSVWLPTGISPSSWLTCYFHSSFVTMWLMSDITKHSSPFLFFQSTPSPSNTRGLHTPTPLLCTPPTTAQNHSTTCLASCPRPYRPPPMSLAELAAQPV